MMSHPFFPDLLMHDDQELEALLGHRILERKTIHEWPLSCVQRVSLGDGSALVYKAQLPPTVEAAFYRRASSNLLPGCRALGRVGECDYLAIDWIDAPLLIELSCGEEELVRHGRALVAEIGEIQGDLPVYLDIGCDDAWMACVGSTGDKLLRLIDGGQFQRTALQQVQGVLSWAQSPAVRRAIEREPRVIHGDLYAKQVFVARDGYRVIDWQRPVLAPPQVDLVNLLLQSNINPLRHAQAEAVGIRWFLLLRWAVEAQHDIFPDSRGPMFDQWAQDAVKNILALPLEA